MYCNEVLHTVMGEWSVTKANYKKHSPLKRIKGFLPKLLSDFPPTTCQLTLPPVPDGGGCAIVDGMSWSEFQNIYRVDDIRSTLEDVPKRVVQLPPCLLGSWELCVDLLKVSRPLRAILKGYFNALLWTPGHELMYQGTQALIQQNEDENNTSGGTEMIPLHQFNDLQLIRESHPRPSVLCAWIDHYRYYLNIPSWFLLYLLMTLTNIFGDSSEAVVDVHSEDHHRSNTQWLQTRPEGTADISFDKLIVGKYNCFSGSNRKECFEIRKRVFEGLWSRFDSEFLTIIQLIDMYDSVPRDLTPTIIQDIRRRGSKVHFEFEMKSNFMWSEVFSDGGAHSSPEEESMPTTLALLPPPMDDDDEAMYEEDEAENQLTPLHLPLTDSVMELPSIHAKQSMGTRLTQLLQQRMLHGQDSILTIGLKTLRLAQRSLSNNEAFYTNNVHDICHLQRLLRDAIPGCEWPPRSGDQRYQEIELLVQRIQSGVPPQSPPPSQAMKQRGGRSEELANIFDRVEIAFHQSFHKFEAGDTSLTSQMIPFSPQRPNALSLSPFGHVIAAKDKRRRGSIMLDETSTSALPLQRLSLANAVSPFGSRPFTMPQPRLSTVRRGSYRRRASLAGEGISHPTKPSQVQSSSDEELLSDINRLETTYDDAGNRSSFRPFADLQGLLERPEDAGAQLAISTEDLFSKENSPPKKNKHRGGLAAMGPLSVNQQRNFVTSGGMNKMQSDRKRSRMREDNIRHNIQKRSQQEVEGSTMRNLSRKERLHVMRNQLGRNKHTIREDFDIASYGSKALKQPEGESKPDDDQHPSKRTSIDKPSPGHDEVVENRTSHRDESTDEEGDTIENEMIDAPNDVGTRDRSKVLEEVCVVSRPQSPLVDDTTWDLLPSLLIENADDGVDYRPGQLEAIQSCVKTSPGATVFIAPTGSGKSFVIHAAALHLKQRNLMTVIVLPTLALVKDFVEKIPSLLRGCEYTGDIAVSHKKSIMKIVAEGGIDILAITPEQLSLSLKYELYPIRDRLGLFALDEAHCISSWGHAFRPAYLDTLSIGCRHLAIPRTLALTATASGACRDDLIRNLKDSMRCSVKVVQPPTHVQRENLTMEAHAFLCNLHEEDYAGAGSVQEANANQLSGELNQSFEHILTVLGSTRWRSISCIIIYTWQRHVTERLAHFLRGKLSNGDVVSFHSGLPIMERNQIQHDFISGKYRIVCATLSLGIGIHQTVVDGVIHFNMPKSVEQYVQETGRCARSMEKPGICHLLLKDDDYREMFQQEASNQIDLLAAGAFIRNVVGALSTPDDPSENDVRRLTGVSNTVIQRCIDMNRSDGQMTTRWVLFSKHEVVDRLLALRSSDGSSLFMTMFNIRIREILPNFVKSLDHSALSRNLSEELNEIVDQLVNSKSGSNTLPVYGHCPKCRALTLKAFQTSFDKLQQTNPDIKLLTDCGRKVGGSMTVEIFDVMKANPGRFPDPSSVEYFVDGLSHEHHLAVDRTSGDMKKIGTFCFSMSRPDQFPNLFMPLLRDAMVDTVNSMRHNISEGIFKLNQTYSVFRKGALYGEARMRDEIDTYMSGQLEQSSDGMNQPLIEAWPTAKISAAEMELFKTPVRSVGDRLFAILKKGAYCPSALNRIEDAGGPASTILGMFQDEHLDYVASQSYVCPSMIARVLCGSASDKIGHYTTGIKDLWGTFRHVPYTLILNVIHQMLEVKPLKEWMNIKNIEFDSL
eukprot:GHVH01013683.1.p1 GENE.GHVH01013683.1~~GHVH01013683.1.p1  ORF type:complete len:1713 (+),score=265.63 GHVH01013683.1:258-5396(+)